MFPIALFTATRVFQISVDTQSDKIMSRSNLSAASSMEVALLASQLEDIRAGIRQFIEEKNKQIDEFMEEKNMQIDDIQQRIESLQPVNKRSRSVSPESEANNKKFKTEDDSMDFTVTEGFTEVMRDPTLGQFPY